MDRRPSAAGEPPRQRRRMAPPLNSTEQKRLDKGLLNAVKNNQVDQVRRRITEGANVHLNNEENIRLATKLALSPPSSLGEPPASAVEIVRVLLSAGADPLIGEILVYEDPDGEERRVVNVSALTYTLENATADPITALDLLFLFFNSNITSPQIVNKIRQRLDHYLIKAVERGDTYMARFFVYQGAETDKLSLAQRHRLFPREGSELDLALLKAVEMGKVDDVRNLLNEGADVHFDQQTNIRHATILAATNSQPRRAEYIEIMKMLLSAGADPAMYPVHIYTYTAGFDRVINSNDAGEYVGRALKVTVWENSAIVEAIKHAPRDDTEVLEVFFNNDVMPLRTFHWVHEHENIFGFFDAALRYNAPAAANFLISQEGDAIFQDLRFNNLADESLRKAMEEENMDMVDFLLQTGRVEVTEEHIAIARQKNNNTLSQKLNEAMEAIPKTISVDGSRFGGAAGQNEKCYNRIDPISKVRIPPYALIRILTRDDSGGVKDRYHCFDVRNLNEWVNILDNRTNPVTSAMFAHRDREIIRKRAEDVKREFGHSDFDSSLEDDEDIQQRMVEEQAFEEHRVARAAARLQRLRNDTSAIARRTPSENENIGTCANNVDPVTQEDVSDIARQHLVHVLAPLNGNPAVQREVCYNTEGLVDAFDAGDYFNADPAVNESSFPDEEQAFARQVHQVGYPQALAAFVQTQRLNRFIGKNN